MKKILVALLVVVVFWAPVVFAASVKVPFSAQKVAGLFLVNEADMSFGELVKDQTVKLSENSPNAGRVGIKASPNAPLTMWFSAANGGAPTSQLELVSGQIKMTATNIGIIANGQTAIGNELNTSCDSTGRCSIVVIGEITAGDDAVNPIGDYSADGYVNVILG